MSKIMLVNLCLQTFSHLHLFACYQKCSYEEILGRYFAKLRSLVIQSVKNAYSLDSVTMALMRPVILIKYNIIICLLSNF